LTARFDPDGPIDAETIADLHAGLAVRMLAATDHRR